MTLEMTDQYKMTIAGLERALPLCRVSDTLYIAAFVMFGDVELTVAGGKGPAGTGRRSST
jgi:adenine phosphoribosyltransferase